MRALGGCGKVAVANRNLPSAAKAGYGGVLYGTAEAVPFLQDRVLTQTLKPDLFSISYVRANARCGEVARTLQESEFFRSLLDISSDHSRWI
jgi:hypothetical protein